MTIERFDIAVPQDVLNNLSDRIARTRWPDRISGSGWDYGTDTAYLKGLLSYWRDGFNWRKREERINRFEHFRTMIDGLQIHFIHAKSRSGRAIHLLLLHGWPSSFLQMLDILPMLTNPPSGDGPDFEVIVPSLPGFGSSPAPDTRGLNERTCASIFVHLMHDVLGFVRFAARGSDIGASILQHLARDPPQRLLGLHLTGICPIVGDIPVDATARELEFVNEARIWMARERAYAMMHATHPQTLAHALNDSPAGLASWIIEKFRAWSDCNGDVERRFSRDEH